MNAKVMTAPFLTSSFSNLFKSENTSQPKLIFVPNSIGTNDFFKKRNVLFTLYSNILTFRDSNKSFYSDGDLLKAATNYDFNITHSNPQEHKLKCEFA